MSNITVQGHRGAALQRPENSIEGVCYAFAAGAFAVELDLQLSSDGVPVVVHDFVLHADDYGLPAGCASLRITRTPIATLSEITFGHPQAKRFAHLNRAYACKIPTLEALIAHPGVQPERLNLELKFDGNVASNRERERFAQILVSLVDHWPALPWRIKSFDQPLIELLDAMRPLWPLHLLAPESADLLNWRLPAFLLRNSNASRGVCLHYAQVTREVVERFKGESLHLSVYTVNEVDEFERLIALGVQDVISDDPVLLLGYLEERAQRK